jgi:hypothetical protein
MSSHFRGEIGTESIQQEDVERALGENIGFISRHGRRLEHHVLARPSKLEVEPCHRGHVHDRLESEPPHFLKEVEDPQRAIGSGRHAIRSHLSLIVDVEQGRLSGVSSYGGEEVCGLARGHLRRNMRAVGGMPIELRLCDSPPLVK